MFESFSQLFTSPKSIDASITSEKFDRFRRTCSKKSRILFHQSQAPIVEHKPSADPWKTHHVFEVEDSYQPCVVYPPESLLVEGSAEKFLTCKLNPIDEFKHLRETRRKEATLSGTMARFKSKKKRSA